MTLLFLTAAGALRPVRATVSTTMGPQAAYPDSLGHEHIIGVVQNTADVWIQFVKVTTVLSAANGTTLDVLTTFTEPGKVPPGGIAGFDNIELDPAKSAAFVQGKAESVISAEETLPVQTHLTILNPSMSVDSLGYVDVVGVVRNNGTLSSTFTKVVGIFFDTQKNLAYVGFTFTSPDTISPGAQYGFKLTVYDKTQGSTIKTASLLTESDQYSSVPEFPWPAIALASALSLGCIAMGRKKGKRGERLVSLQLRLGR